MQLPAMPSMRLDGRRALVTGAGRGIGLACASALASAGAHVTLAARTVPELEQAVAAVEAAGGQAAAMALDCADVGAASAAIAAAQPFDILVNNAGTNRPKPFLDVPVEDFDVIMNLNVRGAFFVAQAVARRLVQAKRPGSIIHMSSQMGHVGGPTRTVYCASKHAIEGLCKAMAMELGRHGIRVNTICPTYVETAMTKPFFENKAFLDSVLAKLPIGRLGQPTDMMGAVVFLASDASAMMTGSALMIDGGWTTG